MTTGERLEKLEHELVAAKRRNRWLLVGVLLAVGIFALVWVVAGAANRAEAQGGGTGQKQQLPLMLMQKAAELQALREKVARDKPISRAERARIWDNWGADSKVKGERFSRGERLLLDNAVSEARLAALAEARACDSDEDTTRLLERAKQLEYLQREVIPFPKQGPQVLVLLPEQKTLVLEAIDLAKAVALAGARAGGNEIRANRFVLEDENGKSRAELLTTKLGSALKLSDEAGNRRAMLFVDKDGPRLSLCDEKGKEIWRAP